MKATEGYIIEQQSLRLNLCIPCILADKRKLSQFL